MISGKTSLEVELIEVFGDPFMGLPIFTVVCISTFYALLIGNLSLVNFLSSYSELHILPRDVSPVSWEYLLTFTCVVAVQVTKVRIV